MDDERGHENPNNGVQYERTKATHTQARSLPTVYTREEGGAARRGREHVAAFLEITCKPHTKRCRQRVHLIVSARG